MISAYVVIERTAYRILFLFDSNFSKNEYINIIKIGIRLIAINCVCPILT